MKSVFKGIRPIVAGLVLAAGLSIGRSVLFTAPSHLLSLNYVTLISMCLVTAVMFRKKFHPMIFIVLAAGVGAISYLFT